MIATLDLENLAQEAEAFDSQIDERIANGHIPDLRRAPDCDWFRNNPWRRAAYVSLDFGEQFALIRDTINELVPSTGNPVRVLEVGCGPGYLSLELARSGFDVTGLDLSPRCIEIAERFAAEDPWSSERGSLTYLAGDFFTDARMKPGSFDAIVFLGALHHFPNQEETLDRVGVLLRRGGAVLVHEPVRDRVSRKTSTVSYLIRSLLSASGTFHETARLPENKQQLSTEIDALHSSLRYEDESGHKLQSVNDNEAGYAEMYPKLHERFAEQRFAWRYGLFHELIGGLRFETEEKNARVAWMLRELDRSLVECGAIDATEFFFAGTKGAGVPSCM